MAYKMSRIRSHAAFEKIRTRKARFVACGSRLSGRDRNNPLAIAQNPQECYHWRGEETFLKYLIARGFDRNQKQGTYEQSGRQPGFTWTRVLSFWEHFVLPLSVSFGKRGWGWGGDSNWHPANMHYTEQKPMPVEWSILVAQMPSDPHSTEPLCLLSSQVEFWWTLTNTQLLDQVMCTLKRTFTQVKLVLNWCYPKEWHLCRNTGCTCPSTPSDEISQDMLKCGVVD